MHKLEKRVKTYRVDSIDLIARFCNNLNLIPEQIEEIMIVSKELLNKHDKELSSCTPPSLSASFIYYYIYKNAINITKKKISEETNISIVTIQKIVNILLKIDVQPKCD